MDRDPTPTLTRRVSELEKWKESVSPMLRDLADDHAYRARWLAERSTSRARRRRLMAWAISAAGGIVVAVSAVVQLVRLF